MLKPIHRVDCSPALAACQNLMKTFALWLCDPATTKVLKRELRAKMPSQIEADWLWKFLKREVDQKPLSDRARVVLKLAAADKAKLKDWVEIVADLPSQFASTSKAWPVSAPSIPKETWRAFKALMEAFYTRGLSGSGGLPFQPDGTPTAQGGVTYADFVEDFRGKHRLGPDPSAREVCVLCGGPLGEQVEVDHWVLKSAYPLLNVCGDNLLPICGTCNSTSHKGARPVHSQGCFDDWFHPYLRPGYGLVQPECNCVIQAVKCAANAIADQPKADNLNRLPHLSDRWTREFKAEYIKLQGELRQRERRRLEDGKPRHTRVEVQAFVNDWRNDLLQSEPHCEVHTLVGTMVADPARLDAWHHDLSDVRV